MMMMRRRRRKRNRPKTGKRRSGPESRQVLFRFAFPWWPIVSDVMGFLSSNAGGEVAPRRARQRASDAGHRAAPNSDNPVGAVVATATATTRRWLACRQRTDIVSLAWSCGFVLKGPSLLEPFRAPWSIGDSVDVIPPTSLHCTNACDSLTRTQGLRIHPLCCLPTSRVVTLSFPSFVLQPACEESVHLFSGVGVGRLRSWPTARLKGD